MKRKSIKTDTINVNVYVNITINKNEQLITFFISKIIMKFHVMRFLKFNFTMNF